jgi:hypothetical protein
MHKFFVTCPCGCEATCEATSAGFSATTVEVAACPTYIERGVSSVTLRKSAAYASAVPAVFARPRFGLVEFA